MKNTIVIYKFPKGNIDLKVSFDGKTIWLTQDQIAEVFGVNRPAITKHLKNIFITKELNESSVCSKMELTASDGKKPKWYERKIKSILRSKNFSIHKLKTVKSSQYPGIRIADMAAGLIRSFYDSKNMNKIEKYYRRLEKKIIITVKYKPALQRVRNSDSFSI